MPSSLFENDPSIEIGSIGHEDDPYLSNEEEDDDGEWFGGQESGDELDLLSNASSVPTTVASATDERTAASMLAQKRAQKKFSASLFILGILLVATVVAAVSIYGFARSEKETAFDDQFESYADQIVSVATLRLLDLLGQMDTISDSFSRQTQSLPNSTGWPFVTIPDFQSQTTHFFDLMESRGVLLDPSSMQVSVLVSEDLTDAWSQYTQDEQWWISESNNEAAGLPDVPPYIFRRFPENGTKYEDFGDDSTIFAPTWMISLEGGIMAIDEVNYNTFDKPTFVALDKDFDADPYTPILTPPSEVSGLTSSPRSTAAASIMADEDVASVERVGAFSASVDWTSVFTNILNVEMEGPIMLTLESSCTKNFMYEITGPNATYIGSDPLLDLKAGTLTSSIIDVRLSDNCSLNFHLVASDQLYDDAVSNGLLVFPAVVLSLVVFVGILFYAREKMARISPLTSAPKGDRSRGIVDSILPSPMRRRSSAPSSKTAQMGVERYPDPLELSRSNKAVADLHPSVTVLYADIVNFTAWASVREPSQVFNLLETLYGTFDRCCKKYKIFKVETIGDCYVAVAGLPQPMDGHATAMARFAREIQQQMEIIVEQLEVLLGPDTGDLGLRIGIDSGPVTAGVIRGEDKAKFQIFGETVKAAARMENTCLKHRIQVTSTTADLIRSDGNEAWLSAREGTIQVALKGDMQTFWVDVPTTLDASARRSIVSRRSGTGSRQRASRGGDLDSSRRSDASSHSHSRSGAVPFSPEEKKDRLVNWSADMLIGLLKRIVAMRESEETLDELKDFQEIVKSLDEIGGLSTRTSTNIEGMRPQRKTEPTIELSPNKTVLDEVAEIISLPRKAARYQQDPNKIDLGESVEQQVYQFVREVAGMYRENAFHNFDHASHVSQSLTKLLSRVVAPDVVDYENMTYKRKSATSKLHKYTYGITSDPITQFACAFSSLIHDMDHPGVPNAVLVQENTAVAKKYRNKSVAEQNSVDLAWSLLMEPRFKDFRQCIYRKQTELDRFRQLVVNSVMATDIVDKELGKLRKGRWEKAFNKTSEDELDEKATDDANRKATIVIEHLIQAADVAHTMQHWHVYLKWNERFFHECYSVYLSGRSDKDPSEGWYKGEIGFFDFYIIPLAKKLENCGVFGVSSDECLQYAQANRAEWERKGDAIVQGYLDKYKATRKASLV